MNSLNSLHYFLIVLMVGLGLSYLLLPKQRQRITTIQRYVVLLLVAILILSPFLWIVSAVFKDTDVLMQYAFLPPLSKWSGETLNLKNFYNPETEEVDSLFEAEKTIEGEVHFWRYLANSLFLASTSTIVTLFFSSLGAFSFLPDLFTGVFLLLAAPACFPADLRPF